MSTREAAVSGCMPSTVLRRQLPHMPWHRCPQVDFGGSGVQTMSTSEVTVENVTSAAYPCSAQTVRQTSTMSADKDSTLSTLSFRVPRWVTPCT